MNKQEFLNRLNTALLQAPDDERTAAISYYKDYFADSEDEQSALSELPVPEKIAESIMHDAGIKKERPYNYTTNEEISGNPYTEGYKKGGSSAYKKTLFTIFLIFIGIWLLIAAGACLISFLAASAAIAAAGIAAFFVSVMTAVNHFSTALFMLGASLTLAGLGILFGMLSWKLTVVFCKGVKQMFKAVYSNKEEGAAA